MNFHAQSQISRSKNGWDMAVGTKEDTKFTYLPTYIYLTSEANNSQLQFIIF